MPTEFYSSGVQLWDKNGASAALNDGNGLLLHPETELRYVKTEVGGGLSSSVNSIWFDPAAAMDSGLETEISSTFCPLEKIVGATTQYADMYTSNASAVITELPGSTGYGTLVNVIQTIDHVRPVTSATNSFVPTEHAVAVAIQGMQKELVAGACLTITPSMTNPLQDDIAVNTKYTIDVSLASCSTNAVPTERAVREAVDNASASINTSVTAVNSAVTNLYTSVTNLAITVGNIHNWDIATTANYGVVKIQNTVDDNTGPSIPTASAIKAYVDTHAGATYIFSSGLTSSGGSVTLDKAGNASTGLGGVWVPNNSGLALGANGRLTLSSATTTSIGGVIVGSGLGVNAATVSLNKATTTSLGGVIVGTGLSVAADGTLSLESGAGGKPVSQGSGITVTSSTDSYTVALNKATYTSRGGIVVNSSGLTVDTNGSLSLNKATTASLGGVIVGNGLEINANGVLSLSAGAGGKPVSEGTGIDVTDNTNSYTVSLEKATTASIGGVMISATSGLRVSATGEAYLHPADNYTTYATALSGEYGGVKVLTSVTSTNNTTYLSSGYVPSVQAVYDHVSNAISAYTVPAAQYVANKTTTTTSLGGIRVVSNSGLGLTTGTSSGNLYLSSATTTALGGVIVGSGLSVANGTVSVAGDVEASYNGPFAVSSDGEDELVKVNSGYVKWLDGQLAVAASSNVSLPFNSILYLTGSSGAIEGQDIDSGTYKIASGASVWSRTDSATSNNRYKWVAIEGNTLGSRWIPDAVPSSGTLMYATANASTAATTGATVTQVVEYSLKTTEDPTIVYKAVDIDPDHTESETNGYRWCYGTATVVTKKYSFIINSTRVYATGVSENGRYAWNTSGTGSEGVQWTASATPVAGATVYRYSTGTDTNGTVASPATSGTEIGSFSLTGKYSSSNKAYYEWIRGTYPDYEYAWTIGTAIDNGSPIYGAPGVTEVIGIAKDVDLHLLYTSTGLPYPNTKTMPTIGNYKFSCTVNQPELPPAGRFYTMLAKSTSATISGTDVERIEQQQYGTVWHEHWGDDYRGQFAVSRVTLNQSVADEAVPGSYPYKYIVNGGRLYGGIDFKSGKLWQGMLTSGGIVMAPGDMEYPSTTVNSVTKNDALYFQYGTTNEVWLNVWSGTWPTTYGGPGGSTKAWHTVVHSVCLEGYIQNCYSVQLGWVTVNGAPQQEHKGAIAIRGRWT